MSYHGQTFNPNTVVGSTQNDSSPAYSRSSLIFTLIGGLVFLFWLILPYLGIYPLAISGALWNIFVYLIPSQIVAALDTANQGPNANESMTSLTIRQKSEAMQRILGLDRSSLYSILPRGRSLSGLGSALLGAREPVPPGLGNWDNSCYQNSVIQGLSSLESFMNFLNYNIRNLDERGPLLTHRALQEITEMLNDPINHGQKFWIPSELKSMSSWQQQDAQEYFSKIMDQLDREIRDALKGVTTNIGLRFTSPKEHLAGASESVLSSEDDVQQRETFANPLEGLLAQRVGCMRCGWTEGLSLIPFNCLTVSIGKEQEYDIRDCLDSYMTLEHIEGVECAKCTLLRTKDQLCHLLKQIEVDEEQADTTQPSKLSETLRDSAQTRLQAVQDALDEEDFTETALSKKCHIPSKSRVSVTKSRQAVIARPPKNLVAHVNRSVFDENTGMLRKNYADVRFPGVLDLSDWCLGHFDGKKELQETWNTDPQSSMLSQSGAISEALNRKYELRAVVTHYGRHENGHYICYRKFSTRDFPVEIPERVEQIEQVDDEKDVLHRWFRLSDEDVQMVSDQAVFNQGGVFMLFYERIDEIEETFQETTMHFTEKDVQNVHTEELSATSGMPAYQKAEISGIASTLSATSYAESDICKSDMSVNSPLSGGSSQSSLTAPDTAPLREYP
ncbi:putative ubiquitin hydrolase [Talaromyces proteolyticus]|uniref:ubiquitinyl hydrolase 1 n=1 Tax=Talaromyces proteolyticus TaxID=1131652 RepID=A0AAD4L2D7_9EURO|nr:putative ubiquitin hydrolase [Talaromyces proteolyticus]KAH8705360.1 putative ubiquitin hydrolase [Talaromyces proteolyticus]